MQPVQWNVVASEPGTLRGFHVHLKHTDYLFVPLGTMLLGLKDLRRHSPTFMLSALVTLSGENLEGWLIPPGVGHGFYFPVPSLHCYAVSHYWSQDDELGCRWDDPALGLAWPISAPLLSERDRTAPSLDDLLAVLDRHHFAASW